MRHAHTNRLRGLLVIAAVVGVLVQLPVIGNAPNVPDAPVHHTPAVVMPATSGVALNLSYAAFSPAAQIRSSLNGVNIRADSVFNNLAFINQTTATYWRYPGGAIAERFNYTTSQIRADSGSTMTAVNNITNFVVMCIQVNCKAILQLPAEINSSTTAAFYVNYVENTLGFKPAYWEVGNEPATWTHFGIAWTSWNGSQNVNTTPFPFAYLVHKYTTAIHAVDASAAVIALGGTGQGSSNNVPWVKQLASFDGGILSAISIHSYVGGAGPGTPTLVSFYGELAGTYSLPNLLPSMRAARNAACGNCTNVSIFVTELGSANNASTYAAAGFLAAFSNAAFMAAEMTQAINFNLSNEDYFAYANSYSGSWVFGVGTATPTYYMFKDVFSLLGPTAYKATVTGPDHHTVYSAGAYSATTCTSSILLVNLNISTPYAITLTSTGFPTTGTGRTFTWNGATAEPTATPWTSISGVVLQPQTITVVTESGCGNGGQGVLTTAWNIVCQSGTGAGACIPNPIRASKVGGVWDPIDNFTILFGGTTNGANAINQTWVWNNSGWTQYTFTTTPTTRANFTMVWDGTDHYVMAFAGYTGSTYRNDTWTFVNNTWTNTVPNSGGVSCTHPSVTHCPSIRAGYQMVYVPVHGGFGGYVLVFGGNAGGTKFYSDTWKYVGGIWTNLTGSVGTPPAGRSEAGIAYDTIDNYVVMFGGLTKTGIVNDTWEFDPVTAKWINLYTNATTAFHSGPTARMSPAMAMDTTDGAVFLYSGASGNYHNTTSEKAYGTKDTWYFFAGNWTNDTKNINPLTSKNGGQVPVPVFGAVFTDQPLYHYVLLEGGKGQGGLLNGTAKLGTLMRVTLAENLGEIYKGQTVKIWANATNGTKPYTYNWSLPSGCVGTNVGALVCIPNGTGFVSISVVVTDLTGNAATAGPIVLWIDSVSSQSVTLSLGGGVPVNPPSTFWALDYRCPVANQPTCIAFIKQTPAHWFRVAGSMEGYNATSGVEYSRFGGVTTVNWNWTAIIAFCAQITPCNTVAAVPTQNNDTGLAVADVKYVTVNYSYQPTRWSLGNEPEGWVHFNQGFSASAYPQPYTFLHAANGYQLGIVENRIAQAIQAYDPGLQLVAIQADGGCSNNQGFMTQTAIYTVHDGNPVISCHSYPGSSGPRGTDVMSPTYYNLLTNVHLTQTVQKMLVNKAVIGAACVGCSAIPIWVTEMSVASQGGLYQPYLQTWANAAFYAAQLPQFMSANVSQMEMFDMGCGTQFALLTTTCGATPLSEEYRYIFNHVRMSQALNVTATTSMANVFAFEGKNASGSSLYLSNANTSVSAQFDTPSFFDKSHGVTVYSGSPNIGWQTLNYSAGHLPTVWTVPPLGVILINSGSGTGPVSGAPPAPLQARICGSGPTNLSVCWTNPAGISVTGSSVQVFTGTSCNGLPVQTITNTGSSWQNNVTALTNGQSYCVVVSLSNGTASSGTSNPTVGAPGAPYGLYAIRATDSSIAVGWGNPSGVTVTNNTVYVGRFCGVWTQTFNTHGPVTAYNVTGLGQGTTYCFATQAWTTSASNKSAGFIASTTGIGPTQTNPGPFPIVQPTTPGPTAVAGCSTVPLFGCGVTLVAASAFALIGTAFALGFPRLRRSGVTLLMIAVFVGLFL